jgi:hypothetical protein
MALPFALAGGPVGDGGAGPAPAPALAGLFATGSGVFTGAVGVFVAPVVARTGLVGVFGAVVAVVAVVAFTGFVGVFVATLSAARGIAPLALGPGAFVAGMAAGAALLLSGLVAGAGAAAVPSLESLAGLVPARATSGSDSRGSVQKMIANSTTPTEIAASAMLKMAKSKWMAGSWKWMKSTT